MMLIIIKKHNGNEDVTDDDDIGFYKKILIKKMLQFDQDRHMDSVMDFAMYNF